MTQDAVLAQEINWYHQEIEQETLDLTKTVRIEFTGQVHLFFPIQLIRILRFPVMLGYYIPGNNPRLVARVYQDTNEESGYNNPRGYPFFRDKNNSNGDWKVSVPSGLVKQSAYLNKLSKSGQSFNLRQTISIVPANGWSKLEDFLGIHISLDNPVD